MTRARSLLLLLPLWFVVGCATSATPNMPAYQPVLVAEWPSVCLPGTALPFALAGVPDDAPVRLSVRLRGSLALEGGGGRTLDWLLPTVRTPTGVSVTLDHKRLDSIWDSAAPDGSLTLSATLLVEEIAGWQTYSSPAIDGTCTLTRELRPEVTQYRRGPFGVNARVTLDGSGFLIAPSEGRTRVLLDGCFAPDGTDVDDKTCGPNAQPLAGVELDALPADRERGELAFVWSPALTGLGGGTFHGNIAVRNDLASGLQKKSPRYAVTMTLRPPRVTKLVQYGASLGQVVDIEGDGFVGAALDEVTLLHLAGDFLPAVPDAAPVPVSLDLVPQFVDGEHVRYVLDEADALGRALDLRTVTGTFYGTLSVATRLGSIVQTGTGTAIEFDLQPVKQVVYIHFADSYRQSLRLFGLAAADEQVRARVLEVARRDYAGVNVEFRIERPTDFLLYTEVDVSGPDPNGLGFFGFDNTPGKDVGNRRLYDRIGGLDATTQSDGTPGYGGIFTEQFLGFSSRPGPAVPLGAAETLFDLAFDPVRPDSGRPVHPSEIPWVDFGQGSFDCPVPRGARVDEVRCAVVALGNLIGSTLTHELGHSLGLAQPEGDGFHDPGDAPVRLMDAGDARPFGERAELGGEQPARFCTAELAYLQTILPPADPRDGETARLLPRPSCELPTP